MKERAPEGQHSFGSVVMADGGPETREQRAEPSGGEAGFEISFSFFTKTTGYDNVLADSLLRYPQLTLKLLMLMLCFPLALSIFVFIPHVFGLLVFLLSSRMEEKR